MTIESGNPVCSRKSSSPASLVSKRNAAAIVNASSSAQAIRKKPAARPPRRHAMNATTSVNTAEPTNIRFPTAARMPPSPNSLNTFEAASTRNATANHPNVAYTRGQKRFRSAISRTNTQAAAPLIATGTFHACCWSGSAQANKGQSKPCPEKKAT